MAQLSDPWYNPNNWHYWFSLIPEAIKNMDIARLAGDETAQRLRLRQMTGVTSPLADYIVRLQGGRDKKINIVMSADRVATAIGLDHLSYGILCIDLDPCCP